MTDYVQGGMFGGMTFAPLSSLPSFGSAPAAPPSFLGATINTTNPQISTGIAGTTPASSVPSAIATPTPAGAGASADPTSYSGFFVRAVVVILGFIFVAVGLTMFASGGSAVQAVKKITPGL